MVAMKKGLSLILQKIFVLVTSFFIGIILFADLIEINKDNLESKYSYQNKSISHLITAFVEFLNLTMFFKSSIASIFDYCYSIASVISFTVVLYKCIFVVEPIDQRRSGKRKIISHKITKKQKEILKKWKNSLRDKNSCK